MLIVLRRDAFVDLVVLLTGLYIAYAGVSELMRLTLPSEAAEAEADRREGRRALIASGVAAAVIVIGSGVFITTGAIREAPAAIETQGCNGSEALCDQPLDQVAFASTHNAMSAATNPDWLFAQQEKGFADQLHDGIRGLFIDAHYGTPTAERPDQDRPLRPRRRRARGLRGRARARGAGRGAADPRPDRQLTRDRPAPGLSVPPLLRARRGPDPARRFASTATSSPPTPTRCWCS